MPKRKPKKSWARETVGAMSDAEVRYWVDRLGVRVEPDTRSPIERLVDEATGCKPKGRK